MSWLRWLLAHLRFEAQYWWLVLTGRGHKPAPQSLYDAYDRVTAAWNKKRQEKPWAT
jgi:hypothetical protein